MTEQAPSIKLGEATFPLHLRNDAFCRLEQELNMSVLELADRVAHGQAGMRETTLLIQCATGDCEQVERAIMRAGLEEAIIASATILNMVCMGLDSYRQYAAQNSRDRLEMEDLRNRFPDESNYCAE